MKNILEIIYTGEILNEDIIYNMMRRIGEGGYTDIEISAFLSALNMRSVSVGELRGLRRAMLELCLPVDLGGIEAMDLCGTGGDGKDTFNISTISSFVVAGAGIPVTKHGNYGVSSKCGSSNVLEALGVTFSNNTDVLKRQLEAANITILHAPLFHPAMKYVAPSRRNMQVKTVFNILGPLTNPTRPKVQVSGVYNLEVGRLYYYLLQETLDRFAVVHSLDGYDEISLTSDMKVFSNLGEKLLTPEHLGFNQIDAKDLSGGDSINEAKEVFLKVISGEGTKEQKSVVLANAGLCISTFKNVSLSDGISIAKESLEKGQAFNALKKLIEITE